jgi:hypothetical protein
VKSGAKTEVGESDSRGLGDAFVILEDLIWRGGDCKERVLDVGSINSKFFLAVGKRQRGPRHCI